MTSTPLAILGCGYGFADAAFIIQWHAIAMFAPSFVTGSLIKRFGVFAVMTTGAMINLLAVACHVLGVDLMLNFLPGMMLIGLGWNFLFIGATTRLHLRRAGLARVRPALFSSRLDDAQPDRARAAGDDPDHAWRTDDPAESEDSRGLKRHRLSSTDDWPSQTAGAFQ
jgi:hypothetical protein